MKKEGKCCLCGGRFVEWGHNPLPLGDGDDGNRCCSKCNVERVIPVRIANGSEVENERI